MAKQSSDETDVYAIIRERQKQYKADQERKNSQSQPSQGKTSNSGALSSGTNDKISVPPVKVISCPKCGSRDIVFTLEKSGLSGVGIGFATGHRSFLIPAGYGATDVNLKHQSIGLCKNCGHLIYQEPESTKSKMVTLLLCIFLGIFGAHRFYTGKILTGALWLFTLGLYGIGWLVDLIMIITDKYKDKNGAPLLKGK